MVKNRIKVISLLTLLFIGFFVVNSVYAQDDDSDGSFEVDTDNDAPSFADFLDQQDAVGPYIDLVVYATILDIDNSTTELNVTFWYSNDTFISNNISVIMAYISNPSTNQYYFTHTLTGQADQTYYQYYYMVDDGNTTVKEDDSGTYFSVQWLKTGSGGSPGMPAGEVPVGSFPEIIINPDLVILCSIVAFVGCSIAISMGLVSDRKTKKHYLKTKNVWFDKRIYAGIIVTLFVVVMIASNFNTYTTFSYEGVNVDWKIENRGVWYC